MVESIQKQQLKLLDIENELLPEIKKVLPDFRLSGRDRQLIKFVAEQQFAKDVFVINVNLLYVNNEIASVLGLPEDYDSLSWWKKTQIRAKSLALLKDTGKLNTLTQLTQVVFTEMLEDAKKELKL